MSRFAYAAWRIAVLPLSYLAFSRPLDEQTCRALFMDQVLTPYAHLFSRSGLVRLADCCGLDVVATRPALRSLMIIALLRVRPKL